MVEIKHEIEQMFYVEKGRFLPEISGFSTKCEEKNSCILCQQPLY